jgi:hypothetical protein
MRTTLFDILKGTAWLVAIVWLLLFPQVGQSETIDVSYELRLGADEGLIEDPDDPVAALLAAWHTQHDLQLARNMPYVQLINTSEMASTEITKFTMTIGDTDHNFDWAQVVATSPGVDVTIDLIDTVENGLRGDVLELGLANFVKDAFVRFRVDLDPDAGDAFPLGDFRTILFDANGNDSEDNSRIEVTFDDPDGIEPVTVVSHLEDYVVVGPLFVAPAFHAHSVTDHVEVFPAGGEGYLEVGVAVPEPHTGTLLVLGLWAMWFWRRRDKR